MKSMVNFLIRWAFSILGGLATGKDKLECANAELNRVLRRFESSAAHKFASVQ